MNTLMPAVTETKDSELQILRSAYLQSLAMKYASKNDWSLYEKYLETSEELRLQIIRRLFNHE